MASTGWPQLAVELVVLTALLIRGPQSHLWRRESAAMLPAAGLKLAWRLSSRKIGNASRAQVRKFTDRPASNSQNEDVQMRARCTDGLGVLGYIVSKPDIPNQRIELFQTEHQRSSLADW